MEIVELNDITLHYSSVSESLYSEWDSATTYNTGDMVYVTLESNGTTERTPHEIYESLADSNTGNYPPNNPDKWSLVGATNRWAMFDGYVNTQTDDTSNIEVIVDSSGCNAVGLFQLQGNDVELSAKDSGPTNGLVLALDFDEGTGSIAYDRSGGDHDATITGATWVDAKFGKGLYFDGYNDYATIPHDSDYDFDTEDDYSISLWLKIPEEEQPDLSIPYHCVLSKPRSFEIWYYSNYHRISVARVDSSDNRQTAMSTETLNDGEWHHVAVTFSSSYVKLYIDGELSKESATSIGSVQNSNPIYLGSYQSSHVYPCMFHIDEFRIYSRLLSEGEISHMAQAYKTETISLDASETYDYWDYFFADFDYKNDVYWPFPSYASSKLYTKITTRSGHAKCGMLAIGKSSDVGTTQYEPSISILDYSKKDTDSLGRTYLSQGTYAKKAEVTMWLYNSKVDALQRKLASLRATPTVFNLTNENSPSYESMVIYGFYQDFDINIVGPTVSRCTLTVEGLT